MGDSHNDALRVDFDRQQQAGRMKRMQVTPDNFVYVADSLTPEEQTSLLRDLRALDYQHDTFRGQRLKRGNAQFGYAYVSTGRKLEAATGFPDFLRPIMSGARALCPDGTEFNQCIVTRYPPGSGIGWHTDAPRFGDSIVGVSLGGAARLQFRRKGADDVSYEVLAESGSMYLMRGPSRWEYQHQVVPVKSERYSLTFRHVTEEIPRRPERSR
jgi:alkylated DNA repair dioxygenase AlkB